tara:strand:- start:3418 stop:3729 length:312 start_codon:yes stop_codon:yes gene_type:complete
MCITGALIWFQTVAPLRFPNFLNKYTWVVYLLGLVTSILFVEASKIGAGIFKDAWTLRFLGFSINTIVFAIFTHFAMGGDFSTKTILCLTLSVSIVLIQCFWK